MFMMKSRKNVKKLISNSCSSSNQSNITGLSKEQETNRKKKHDNPLDSNNQKVEKKIGLMNKKLKCLRKLRNFKR